MNSRKPFNATVWKKDGSIIEYQDAVTLTYEPTKGTRRIKLLKSNLVRTLRDVCIFKINDLNVYI